MARRSQWIYDAADKCRGAKAAAAAAPGSAAASGDGGCGGAAVAGAGFPLKS